MAELLQDLEKTFGDKIEVTKNLHDELTVQVKSKNLLEVAIFLKDSPTFRFEMLMDLCAVDYLHYGTSEWATVDSTSSGFSRGVKKTSSFSVDEEGRFFVVYHLLSVTHNHRIRLKTEAAGEPPMVPSVMEIWNCANWYEREAFDLFGIWFDGHPDLRRILTDYGFIGHPFRKDFPLIGELEMRYSASEQRVIYEAVDIEPRTLVPKVIREDNRYLEDNK